MSQYAYSISTSTFVSIVRIVPKHPCPTSTPFITLFGEISVRIMSSVSMLPLTAVLLQRNITVVGTKDMRITELSSKFNGIF